MHANLALSASGGDSAAVDDLDYLLSGGGLDEAATERLFTRLVRGELDDAQIAEMLLALNRGEETPAILTGAARALRAADAPFEWPDYLFADSCGTGGDGSGSINISTAAAFAVAAAGLPVAKHGNRSVTSRCGSADVLEALGARLDPPAATSRRALDQTGFCFLFAPQYHPGLRHAGPVRKRLGVRTIMNIVGPCVNPAEPPVQLIGVASASLLDPVAMTLLALGTSRALVVHGSGLDEIALHDETRAIKLDDGGLEAIVLTPEAAGLARAPVAGTKGGDPAENAVRLRDVLHGAGPDADTDIVAINAGALLMTGGIAVSLREGSGMALDALRSGAAGRQLDAFIEASRG